MKKVALLILILPLIFVIGFFVFTNSDNDTPREIALTPSPEAIASNYTDPDFGYKLSLPEDYKIEKQTKYSTLFYPETQAMGVGTTNFIYVSIIPPEVEESVGEVYNYDHDNYHKLTDFEEMGESVNLSDNSGQAQWYNYTLSSIVTIDGREAKNFENNKPWEFPAGTTENRFVYEKEGISYLLGYYTGGDLTAGAIDPRVAYSIIQSFNEE